MADFVRVAKKSEIPLDTGMGVEVNGTEIALFRKGDHVYALYAVCPHQGGPLHEGGFDGKEAICPWHGWSFNVTNGKCTFDDSVAVPTFKTKVEGEDVYVEA